MYAFAMKYLKLQGKRNLTVLLEDFSFYAFIVASIPINNIRSKVIILSFFVHSLREKSHRCIIKRFSTYCMSHPYVIILILFFFNGIQNIFKNYFFKISFFITHFFFIRYLTPIGFYTFVNIICLFTEPVSHTNSRSAILVEC